MPAPELYAGLMSGTSLDGIDAALVDFSDSTPHLVGRHFQPFAPDLAAELLALNAPVENELQRSLLAGNRLAEAYATAIASLLSDSDCRATNVRAIGCHGQTVRHRPDLGYTLQIGNAALLAERSGITVVSDFRSRDIAAGGQGAPLVPAFHAALLRHPTRHRTIVNIGGICNLTDLPPQGTIKGFDCGPGNILMDGWIHAQRQLPYDADGAWARTGTVQPDLLARLLDEPFFRLEPPKSSGRDLFNAAWLQARLNGCEAPQDVQATLLELTCHPLLDALQQHCSGAQDILLCGGGAHNLALRARLQAGLPDCTVDTTDTLGISGDYLEAMAFAWLARQALRGGTGNLIEVTGAATPRILGAIHPA